MLDTYRGGYIKALLDVRDMITDRKDSLSYRKVLTKKAVDNVSAIVSAMIDGRDALMRFGPNGCDLIQRPDGTFLVKEER